MEGPSLKAIAHTLLRFEKNTIISASGNAKIAMDKLNGQKINRIYTIGKLLFLEMERISMKIHFLMYGSYRINEERKGMKPRLSLYLESGLIHFYNCAIRTISNKDILKTFDREIDILSPEWKSRKVIALTKQQKNGLICDVLLDQDIYAGVGNIIKNEALFAARIHPLSVVGKIPAHKIRNLSLETRRFSQLFYETRKKGLSMAEIQKIYRQRQCPFSHGVVVVKKTGDRKRRSYFCPSCQIFYV